jgi:hypothetical protein
MAATVSLASATSLEGQVFESLRELQQAEDAWVAEGLTLDPQQIRDRRVSVSTNIQNGTMTFDVTLPITASDSPNGYLLTVAPYIV